MIMKIETYKCDRCGREIPYNRIIGLTVDQPAILSGAFKIINNGMHMDLCIYCYSDLTKKPIDIFIKYFQ